MGRYGRLPEDMQQDENQPALEWDWDDEDDTNNDDMFGQPNQASNEDESDNGELPSGDIEGAALSEDMKEKAKNSHLDPREESSQGGSKFRELMARASKQSEGTTRQGLAYDPPPQPQQTRPSANHGNTAHGGGNVSIPPNAMDLSIEQQAALFRQMMMEKQDQLQQQNPYSQEMAQFEKQQQQQERKMKDPYQTAPPRVYGPPPDLRNPYAQQQYQAPPPEDKNYREYGTGYDGRRIGRNKDAETVSNSADVYFAQLKRDSTSRNYARYAGDDEVANQVFHDPKIQEIYVPENPYRKAQREREAELIETAPEEMLIFQDYSEVEEKQAAPRMTYKEKLARFRNKHQGGSEQ